MRTRDLAAIALGYEDHKEFQEKTGLGITESTYGVYVGNAVDYFYMTYSSLSSVSLNKNLPDPFADPACLKQLKKRVNDKLKQQRVLEDIKQHARETIKLFLMDSFEIDEDKIESSDIVFDLQRRFMIAGKPFYYFGNITNKSFEIISGSYTTFRNMFEITRNITEYFNNKPEKQEQYDS